MDYCQDCGHEVCEVCDLIHHADSCGTQARQWHDTCPDCGTDDHPGCCGEKS